MLSIWKKGNLNFIKTQRLTLAQGSGGSRGRPALCGAVSLCLWEGCIPTPGRHAGSRLVPTVGETNACPEAGHRKEVEGRYQKSSLPRLKKGAEEEIWGTIGGNGGITCID